MRLVGGSTANEGRVEVYHRLYTLYSKFQIDFPYQSLHCSDVWGTVCDKAWDMQDADVVCRQLGYPGASGYRSSATFGEGSGIVWMDNVQCNGEEQSLSTCNFNGWRSDCDHSQDAGVVCCESCAWGYHWLLIECISCVLVTSLSPGDIRLDGSTKGFEGRVEIYYRYGCKQGQRVNDGMNSDRSMNGAELNQTGLHDCTSPCHMTGWFSQSGLIQSVNIM